MLRLGLEILPLLYVKQKVEGIFSWFLFRFVHYMAPNKV